MLIARRPRPTTIDQASTLARIVYADAQRAASTALRQDSRRSRVDRLGVIRIADAFHAVAPDAIEARKTNQGYLRVEARLARDGLQQYSDGMEQWLEYRDRKELDAAGRACLALVVTDDHPPTMVDASSTTPVARGWAMDGLRVETIDKVSYLCGTIVVYDQSLIDRIAAGKVEMSIGFRARIVDSRKPGARYEQIDIELNHVSFVDDARGGPQVRALLDGRLLEVA